MKVLVITVMLMSFPVFAVAEPGGIENSNFNTSLSGSNSDIGNRFRLSGEARFPATEYTGISLSVGMSEFSGKDSYVDSSDKSIGLGALLRKYDLGSINVGYRYSESEADIPSGSIKNDFDTFSLSGTYYMDMFDISLSRTSSNSNTGSDFNSSSISAAYYANLNLKIRVLAGGMDSDETYFLGASYQPEAFNNAISVSASYQNTKTNDSYTVSILYYFDTKVSLIDRTRRF